MESMVVGLSIDATPAVEMSSVLTDKWTRAYVVNPEGKDDACPLIYAQVL